MRLLTLVRHAKSSWTDPGLSDEERPLNKRGLRDGPRMARRFAERAPRPVILVSSSALRASTTAGFFASALGINEETIQYLDELYTFDSSDLLAAIQALPDQYSHVCLFGHNPAITTLSNQLSGESINNIPTAGITHIAIDRDQWQKTGSNSGKLVFFDYPKRLD